MNEDDKLVRSPLAQAQREIADDRTKAYGKYVTGVKVTPGRE